MSKSSKTSSTQNTSITPTNPQWVDQGLAGFGGQVSNLAAQDPYSFIAPQSAAGTQALQDAQSRVGQVSPYTTEAQGAISTANSAATPYTTEATIDPTSTFSGQTAYGGIANYMDPYTGQVIDAAANDINHQAAIADQQAKSAAASAGAWSGDGAQVLRGITGANYSRDLATTIAGLRDKGFTTALSASQQDADRAQAAAAANAGAANARAGQQATLTQDASARNQDSNNQVINRYLTSAQLLGGLGASTDATDLARIQQLGGLGATQQGIDQAKTSAPITTLGALGSIFDNLPLSLDHGQTGTSTSTGTGKESGASLTDWLNYFSANAQAAARAGG